MLQTQVAVSRLATMMLVFSTLSPEVTGYTTARSRQITTIDYDLADLDEFGADPGALDSINFGSDIGYNGDSGFGYSASANNLGPGIDPFGLETGGGGNMYLEPVSDEDIDAAEVSSDNQTPVTLMISMTPDNDDNIDVSVSTNITPDPDNNDNQDDVTDMTSLKTEYGQTTASPGPLQTSKSLKQNVVTKGLMKEQSVKTRTINRQWSGEAYSANEDGVSYRSNLNQSLENKSINQNSKQSPKSATNASDNVDPNEDIDHDFDNDNSGNTNSAESGVSVDSQNHLRSNDNNSTNKDIRSSAVTSADGSQDKHSDDTSQENGGSKTGKSIENQLKLSLKTHTDRKSVTDDGSSSDSSRSSSSSNSMTENDIARCFTGGSDIGQMCNVVVSLHSVCTVTFTAECREGTRRASALSAASESGDISRRSADDNSSSVSSTLDTLKSLSASTDDSSKPGLLDIMNMIRNACPDLCFMATNSAPKNESDNTTRQVNETNRTQNVYKESVEDSFDDDLSADDKDDDVNMDSDESVDTDYTISGISDFSKAYKFDISHSDFADVPVKNVNNSVASKSDASANSNTGNNSNVS